MYDLNIIPINRQRGEVIPDAGGFRAVTAPKRSARGRSDDQLVFFFSTEARDITANQDDWLMRLMETFFKTSGSVTAALRTIIETINLTLLEQNLKATPQGKPPISAISVAVVHRNNLYLAQSGATHAYVFTSQGLAHYTDADFSDRGLGVSRTPTIRYYQCDLGQGGYLFMTTTPPPSWTEALLTAGQFPNLDQLRRRLLNQTPAQFRMGLVQIIPGEGKIIATQPEVKSSEHGPIPVPDRSPSEVGSDQRNVVTTAPPVEGDQSTDAAQAEAPGDSALAEDAEPARPVIPSATADADRQPTGEPQVDSVSSDDHRSGAGSWQPASRLRSTVEADVHPSSQPVKARREAGSAAREALARQKNRPPNDEGLKRIARLIGRVRQLGDRIATFFAGLAGDESQEGGDKAGKPSKGSLMVIAIIVPLIVVAIGATVYLRRGKAQQYQYYYEQATIYAEAASVTVDPMAARVTWEQALDFIQQAQSYRTTDDSALLLNRVQTALDQLDGAVRLDYRPALVESLTSQIEITRIVPYGSDLYLLDEAGGRIIHANRVTDGYEVNPDFVCAAGSFIGGSIGPLVDMVPMPINNAYQAHVLAVDQLGQAVYCGNDIDPLVFSLPVSTAAIGTIESEGAVITYDSGYLYLLNPTAGTLLVYQGLSGQFTDAPDDFFEGIDYAERPELSQVVDLTANGSDLYLLRKDGSLVRCTSSGLPSDPVRCEDPVIYMDGRAGMEDQTLTMPESTYSSVLYVGPTEPSINILDAPHADIYRFSLSFRLHQRMRPSLGDYELEDPTATAFTIGIDRVAFLAFGHQLFFAYVK